MLSMPQVTVFGCDDSISKSHCRTQLEMLIGQYKTVAGPPSTELHIDAGEVRTATGCTPSAGFCVAHEIAEQYSSKPDMDVTWVTVLKFHRALLSLLPIEELRRAAWALRVRYRDMFGEREFSTYLASNPPDLDDAGCSRENLLADMDTLLERTYSNYAMAPENSWILRRRVRATMITIGVALTILAVALIFAAPNHIVGSTILVVGFAGSIGGFVSVLQRLRQLGGSADALTDYHEIQSVRYTTIFASGLTGVLFAAVLYLLFAGGLVQGNMFPNLGARVDQAEPSKETFLQGRAEIPAAASSTDLGASSTVSTTEVNNNTRPASSPSEASRRPKSSVFNLISERHPLTPQDFALLVVWSFLAGFFERLVPDNLNRLLAKKAELQA